MSKDPSNLPPIFSAKDRSALQSKGFTVKQKGAVTLVTCSQCNTEWSCHATENRHEKIVELGKHFLAHVKPPAPVWTPSKNASK